MLEAVVGPVLGALVVSAALGGCTRGTTARRACRGRAGAALVALALAGCSRTGLGDAVEVASRRVAETGQAQCRVARDPDKPLIVEWSGMDAGELEARLLRGIVAVRYEGCEMEVLRGCTAEGAYAYADSVTRVDRVQVRSEEELMVELPLGAARLGGRVERGEDLDLEVVVVGRYDAPQAAYERAALVGADCGRATHVVAGVSLGAFRLAAAESSRRGGDVGVGPAQGGRDRQRSVEVIKESPPGRIGYCMDDAAPMTERRAVCGAPIRLEVAPLVGAAATVPAAPVASAARDEVGGSVEAHRLYALAVALQADEDASPEHRASAWCAVAGVPAENPYLAEAERLCSGWRTYTDALRAAEGRLYADYSALRELLAIGAAAATSQREAIAAFLAAHAGLGAGDYPEIRAVQRAARRLADGKRASLPEPSPPRELRVSRIRLRR